MAGQANLRVSFATAFEQAALKLKVVRVCLQLERGARNQFRLVEATLAQLPTVQGYGHDKDAAACEKRLKIRDGIGEHAAENVRGWTNSVILQKVDQFAQPGVVAAVGSGFLIGRCQPPAQPANGRAFFL